MDIHNRTRSKTSSSIQTQSSSSTTIRKKWYGNRHTKNIIMSTSSAFYALVISIFAVVYELNHYLFAAKDSNFVRLGDVIICCYLHGIGIIFLCFCYYELYARNCHWPIRQKLLILLRLGSIKEDPRNNSNQSEESIPLPRQILSTGSLFLRIGCIVFGLTGLIYYAFTMISCLRDSSCRDIKILLYVLGVIFIVIQGHFILCNWKISKTRYQLIARFGTMHLVGTNLWTWFRFLLVEQAIMRKEVHEFFLNSNFTTTTKEPNFMTMTEATTAGHGATTFKFGTKPTIHDSLSSGSYECIGSTCLTSGVTVILLTSLVEYSLIGAAVMFVVWRNIKHEDDNVPQKERSEILKLNFKNTAIGFFLGIVFLTGCITSMVLFYVFSINGNHQTSTYVVSITGLSTIVVMSIACLFGLYQMRLLTYADSPENEKEESQELLDVILLTVGMTAYMVYAGAGLLGLIQSGVWNGIQIINLLALIFKFIQAGLQSILIYFSQKLRVVEDYQIRLQSGKQAITFLLIGNISIFLLNLFESDKYGVSQTGVSFFGEENWVYLVRTFTPLTIFYRFHSSVCLAEIWRNTYAERIEE